MKYFLVLFFLLVTFSGKAQVLEVSYSPSSIRGWGSLPKTEKYNLGVYFKEYSYNSFHYLPGVRYSHVNSKSERVDKQRESVNGEFNMIFFVPAAFDVSMGNFAYSNRMGFGFSDLSFPNENGLRLNFLLEAGFKYRLTPAFSLLLRYSHISNGYRGETNPGVDNLVAGVGLSF